MMDAYGDGPMRVARDGTTLRFEALPPDDRLTGAEHPDGPCLVTGCRVCEGLERAYQAALKIVFPAPGEGT